MKKLVFIALFLSICFNSWSFEFIKDSLAIDTIKRHSPKKAGYYSAIVPGLGQIYNKQYIKVPFIYALGTVTIGLALNKHTEYKVFRTVNDLNKEGNYTNQYQSYLKNLGKNNPVYFEKNRDEARTQRDLFYVYTGVVYLLNIVDALVSAHLKEFTVSDDLSLLVEPTILFENNKASTGFALTLNF